MDQMLKAHLLDGGPQHVPTQTISTSWLGQHSHAPVDLGNVE